MTRTIYASGSPWEETVGYSRVVKTGNIIEVAGTTASDHGAVIGVNDYYRQTHYILQKIEHALIEADGAMKDVTRTRIFVCDITKWEDVARAHTEFFKDIKPAATMVEVSRLIAPELLVEIEVTAVIS
ncbi:MAG: RidA family protein [Bacteroidota bacterium]|nr:RidA family protein [Bacteroidota bacterium]